MEGLFLDRSNYWLERTDFGVVWTDHRLKWTDFPLCRSIIIRQGRLMVCATEGKLTFVRICQQSERPAINGGPFG